MLNVNAIRKYEDEYATLTRNEYGRVVGADAKLFVEFYLEPQEFVQDDGSTIWKDVPFITIYDPKTANMNKIIRPAHARDAARFPVEWKKFQDGQRGGVAGFPLRECALVSPADLRTLTQLGIHTVEQLSEMDARQASRYGVSQLKEKAKIFLIQKQENSKVEQISNQMAKKDQEIELMKAQLEEMRKIMAAQQAATEEPAKRGRPAKTE